MKNSTDISLDSIVAAAPDQVSCELEGDAAVLNLSSGAYHGLNSIGATVWNLIASPIAVHRVVEALVAEYDVERSRCEGDLLELLRQLDSRGLIQVNGGSDR